MSDHGLLQLLKEMSFEYGNAVLNGNESTARAIRNIAKITAQNMLPERSDTEEEAWYLLGLTNIVEHHAI